MQLELKVQLPVNKYYTTIKTLRTAKGSGSNCYILRRRQFMVFFWKILLLTILVKYLTILGFTNMYLGIVSAL